MLNTGELPTEGKGREREGKGMELPKAPAYGDWAHKGRVTWIRNTIMVFVTLAGGHTRSDKQPIPLV